MKKGNFIIAFFGLAIVSVLSLSFKEKETKLSKSAQMVTDWERAKAYTLEYLNASTDEAIAFKPTEEMRTFGQQMLHMAEANYGLMAAASGKQSPITFGQLEKNADQYKTKEALTKAVMDSYDFAINAVKSTEESKLGETIKMFNFEMTREVGFQKTFEHQTHHRGQTTVYLRLKGIKPPNEKLF
jgi:uncharacterized damage-inducible protein DinB